MELNAQLTVSDVPNEDLDRQEETINHISAKSGYTRLLHADYDVPCLELAKNLLGHQLCRRLDTGNFLFL